MSKLEKLIAELCPDGVEYFKVGDVCTSITDYTAAGSFADIAKNVKYMSSRIGYAQLIRTTDLKNAFQKEDKFVYVDEHAYKYLWRVNLDSEALVLPNVGNCGEVYYITPDIFPLEHNVLGPNAILVKSTVASIRFLYHLLLSKEFQNKLEKIISPTGQTKFNKTNFKKLMIPVPPLPVQNEIVRILDNFTELTAELKTELTAELTARKKQYEYYRDSLLTFEDEVEWKTLGTICDINTGSKPPKIHKELNIYQYINAGTTNSGFTENYNSDGGVVTTPSRGQGGIGFVGYQKNRFWLGPLCYRIQTVNEKHVLAKYVYYYLQNNKELILKIKNEGGVPSVNKVDLEKISVKIPPFVEQQRIVAILDRFDTLCNDISSGLPAEIEARTKQYEYYRDKLLTFPERA